jgi:hypothetical protein
MVGLIWSGMTAGQSITIRIRNTTDDITLFPRTMALPTSGSTINITGLTGDKSYAITQIDNTSQAGNTFDYSSGNSFTTLIRFTNAGATGANGPTLSQVQSVVPSITSVVSGIQYYTIPSTKTYRITIAGAGVTNSNSTNIIKTGFGFVFTVDYSLNSGDVLAILVGQSGTVYLGAGGSGGTFVVKVNQAGSLSGAVPLFISGGAGGPGYESNGNSNINVDASNSIRGNDGKWNPPNECGVGSNGPAEGILGIYTGHNFSGPGAGYSGDPLYGGAKSFLSGGVGGSPVAGAGVGGGAFGGFGGGGGSPENGGTWGGGGGGGYGGGGNGGTNTSGAGGGGGGSYSILGSITTGSASNNTHGYVMLYPL